MPPGLFLMHKTKGSRVCYCQRNEQQSGEKHIPGGGVWKGAGKFIFNIKLYSNIQITLDPGHEKEQMNTGWQFFCFVTFSRLTLNDAFCLWLELTLQNLVFSYWTAPKKFLFTWQELLPGESNKEQPLQKAEPFPFLFLRNHQNFFICKDKHKKVVKRKTRPHIKMFLFAFSPANGSQKGRWTGLG